MCYTEIVFVVVNIILLFSFSFLDLFINLLIIPLNKCRFRPMVAVSFVQSELGFSNSEDCFQFLSEKGAVFNADKTKVDCKLSTTALQAV